MEQHLSPISAEELFGKTSHLVTHGGESLLSDIASLGTLYQIATGVVALLFIFILVRHFDLFRYLIISSVSKKSDRSDIHIYSTEIKNIELFTSLIGVLLLSLLMMRLSVIEEVRPYITHLSSLSAWAIGAITFGCVLATMCGERIMLYIVGAISGQNDACNTIWHIKLLHFSLIIILISPLLILLLLTEGLVANFALYTSVAICLISLILFIKETFSLFRAQRFSIFHWFLYLCALEIFPLSLLLAPILRG